MHYSDVSCNVENTLKKMKRLEIDKTIHVDWLGIITFTMSGKFIIDGEMNCLKINNKLIVNLLRKKIRELEIIEDGIIFKFNENNRKINMIVSPIRAHENYKVFFICCTLDESYTERDLAIIKFVTKVSYENVLLDNEIIKERNYLKNLFNSVRSFIIGMDLNGNITTANLVACEVFGWQLKDIIGKNYSFFMDEEVKIKLQKSIGYVIDRNKSYYAKETIYSSSVGGKKIINLTISPINNNKDQVVGVVVIGTDVTKQKIYEREIEQLKQFAVLGELAAGVAHDIKNPLMSIRGCARILEKKLSEQLKYNEFIEPIIYEVDRINETIEQMLSYSFITKEENYSLLNINEVLEKCFNVIRFHKEFKYINIEKKFSKNLPLIKGNNVQLQQAFINILLNAVQAIEIEGVIRIESYNFEDENKVLVIISDNGNGIEKKEIDQIFQPFYSTKSGGTGLGLPIVKRVIEKHGGKIFVHSNVDKGTKFKVYLPY
ncbi:two-component system sensor histidine kinase NtrB [Crassaminicella profunda]|uniref:two-component system sensor histidine kinase NtrB n=1 Tax=Crassaminicella profunda TaxID=1286698 RepID=UPI001CA66675|nr:ATP-binding protein [Crassaminicella profunda]QZY54002.1 PAS domain S-box protein [Crassaminicella profunda]